MQTLRDIHWAGAESTAPTAEPITLEEAKLHAKIDIDDDDDLLTSLIKAARQRIEVLTQRQLVTATRALTLDRFPGDFDAIETPRPPLASVTSIQYVDTDGDTQTLSADNYRADTTSTPGRITNVYGEVWPDTRRLTGAVTVTYVCGYGGADDVPDGLKIATNWLVTYWYENRQPTITGTTSMPMPQTLDWLLASFKTHTVI